MATWAIITRDRIKAKETLDRIVPEAGAKITAYNVGKTRIEAQFENGLRIRWLNPYENMRGYKIDRAWIDVFLRDTETMRRMIVPILNCGEEGVRWF